MSAASAGGLDDRQRRPCGCSRSRGQPGRRQVGHARVSSCRTGPADTAGPTLAGVTPGAEAPAPAARSTCSSGRRSPARPRPPPRRSRRRSTSPPTRRAAAFFDVDNTVMQGASIFHLARGLHRRKFFTTRDILGAAWKQAYFRVVGVEDPEHVAEARNSALAFIAGHTVDRARGARRGDLRRGDGAPDLAGHPRAGPDAPRPGPAGLAGDRGADRDRQHHRPPARADRRDGHGRRARRRRLHRPAGRRHAARPGQGRGGQGARRPRGARPGRCSAYSDSYNDLPMLHAGRRPVRDQPRRPAARPRPRAGLADPRLPHRPQGGPARA